MRATLGAGLLMVSTMMVGVSATAAEAASVCDDGLADTTWVGPATQDGSASWAEPSNWNNGEPAATSSVCIPATTTGPHVLEGTAAEAHAVTLEGTLTVAGSLEVATLEGVDFGELHGPGTTTVAQGITGRGLTLLDDAVVDLRQGARTVLGGELLVYDGSRLNARGSVVLADGATIDSFGLPGAGLFTIAKGGWLTLEASDSSATVQGGFANHGLIAVTAGQQLMMFGAAPEDALPEQFSTGVFIGAPDAFFNVSGTELRNGVGLEHVTLVDHVTVPEGDDVAAVSSSLADVVVDGELHTQGVSTLDGADVSGEVDAESGVLSVSRLAPTTLREDGTLTQGRWVAWPGATLNLPSVTTIDAWVIQIGPDASFGDALANLTGIGPNGNLELAGHLAVPGRFRNEGILDLGRDSRLDVGGKFRQLATGTLMTHLDAAGRGRVRVAGPRDVAGDLWVERPDGYEPPVGTVLNIITSNGREGADDRFDHVVSPPYGVNSARKLRVAYERDHVRLWADRIG